MAALAQATGYAVLALGCIASNAGKAVLVRDIAANCELPAPFLAKIVNRLARAGLVNTQRGINGGVVLARPATAITLLEVCGALDDPVLERRCMLGTAECSDARACPAHAFNMAQRAKAIAFLSETTIADIAAFEMRRRYRAPITPYAPFAHNASQPFEIALTQAEDSTAQPSAHDALNGS